MKMINWNFGILKEHNSFTLWKFQPDIPTSFGEIVFEKPPKLQRMYEAIIVIFQFLMLFFSLLLIAKSWNLHKLHKLTSSLIFEPSWYIRLLFLWVNSYANEQKWRHDEYAH